MLLCRSVLSPGHGDSTTVQRVVSFVKSCGERLFVRSRDYRWFKMHIILWILIRPSSITQVYIISIALIVYFGKQLIPILRNYKM